uniref:Uncharacterized protein n=1 Tax=Hemiselmis andersenii TaxID=464988 RepID=A0A6U2EYR5_HEMAN|mmetsp:Transcript_29448/g.68822  ORF Transcript_29448/g.68822 Transcript_29448/m.68822 type:complete len:648 (+) Transcript_29448:115-2058(+)
MVDDTELRRKQDAMKKRKRRNLTADLLQKFKELLPTTSRRRTLNDTLVDAAKEVRRQKAASKGGSRGQGPASSSSPNAASETSIDGIMKQAMLSSIESGVGLVTSKLEILDASPALTAMLLAHPPVDDVQQTNSSVQASLRTMNLANFILPRDAEYMQRSMEWLRVARFDSEDHRRFTLGISPVVAGVRKDPFPLDIYPVPLPSAPDGTAFVIIGMRVTDENPIDVMKRVRTRIGHVFQPAAANGTTPAYCPLEMSHEVDERGVCKVDKMHQHVDPVFMLLAAAQQMVQEKSVEEFDQLIQEHPSAIGVAWNVMKWAIRMNEWNGTESIEELGHSICTLLGQDMQLLIQEYGKGGQMQCRLRGVCLMQTRIVPGDRVGEGKMNMCGVVSPEGADIGVTGRVLANGTLWFHSRDPVSIPMCPKAFKGGKVTMYVNQFLKPDFLAKTLSVRKFVVTDNQISNSFRSLARAERENPHCGDFALYCHLLGVLHKWNQSKTLSKCLLKCSRFNVVPKCPTAADSAFSGAAKPDGDDATCTQNDDTDQDFATMMLEASRTGWATPDAGSSLRSSPVPSLQDFMGAPAHERLQREGSVGSVGSMGSRLSVSDLLSPSRWQVPWSNPGSRASTPGFLSNLTGSNSNSRAWTPGFW